MHLSADQRIQFFAGKNLDADHMSFFADHVLNGVFIVVVRQEVGYDQTHAIAITHILGHQRIADVTVAIEFDLVEFVDHAYKGFFSYYVGNDFLNLLVADDVDGHLVHFTDGQIGEGSGNLQSLLGFMGLAVAHGTAGIDIDPGVHLPLIQKLL